MLNAWDYLKRAFCALVFSTLRVYALYGRVTIFVVLIFLCASFDFAANIVSLFSLLVDNNGNNSLH